MYLIQRLRDQAFDGEGGGGLSLAARGEGQINGDNKNVFRRNQNCHRSVIDWVELDDAIIDDATQTCHMTPPPT